jgi:D-arabinose 5-phosphate isomerase GutQ
MWQQENQKLVVNKISDILDATDITYAEKMTGMFDSAKRIFISGAGRSKLVGNFLGMRLMHSGYDVSMVGEIVTPSI